MRVVSLCAGALGLIVLIWQIPQIGSVPAAQWMPLAALGIAVVLLAVFQLRHGG